jgi:glycosyltransferase involved in cell wall biosynthesis
MIRHAHATIVVSDLIAEWYQRKYRLANVHTVKNIPDTREMNLSPAYDLKQKFGIPADQVLYIYNGILAEGRGVEILLKIFSQVGPPSHMVFMGFGPLEAEIKDQASRHRNIHYHPAVRHSEIIAYSKTADIGVSLIEDISLSYRYCLPNKVFEYLLGGLPILVSDLPEMGRLVEKYQCGWKVAFDEKAISATIARISTGEIRQKREHVLQCQKHFSWSEEEKKLLSIYLSDPGGCLATVPQVLGPSTKVPPRNELSDATSSAEMLREIRIG